ncbi:MAG: hypothetical protein DSO07_04870 [Thermoproteota archaeon]|nr:MAG: hypothetical protein DSO07_04870 [Candidatus Korarchaeota archaeon]
MLLTVLVRSESIIMESRIADLSIKPISLGHPHLKINISLKNLIYRLPKLHENRSYPLKNGIKYLLKGKICF